MYRIYKNILHSFPGDFKILVKSDIIKKNFMAHFLSRVSRMNREVSHVCTCQARSSLFQPRFSYKDCSVKGLSYLSHCR